MRTLACSFTYCFWLGDAFRGAGAHGDTREYVCDPRNPYFEICSRGHSG